MVALVIWPLPKRKWRIHYFACVCSREFSPTNWLQINTLSNVSNINSWDHNSVLSYRIDFNLRVGAFTPWTEGTIKKTRRVYNTTSSQRCSDWYYDLLCTLLIITWQESAYYLEVHGGSVVRIAQKFFLVSIRRNRNLRKRCIITFSRKKQKSTRLGEVKLQFFTLKRCNIVNNQSKYCLYYWWTFRKWAKVHQ